ncbi:hypothetical protein KA005_63930 [bacterium]|nr:hypothetical protein [bacterium]
MTYKQKYHFVISICLFALFSVISCNSVNSNWHKYQNQNSEIWCKRRVEFTVVTHGWKIIEGSIDKAGNYVWGWEVILMLNKVETDKTYLLGIDEIEYTLFDKDNFKLVSSKLNLDDSGGWVREGGSKFLLIEAGKTEIYRQTSPIPKQTALRAKYGICRIKLEN